MAGARSGRAHKSDGRRYIGESDELLSTVLELGATPLGLPALSSSSDHFLRSIGNFLPRQLTANLSIADAVERHIWIGRRMLGPGSVSPLFQAFRSRG